MNRKQRQEFARIATINESKLFPGTKKRYHPGYYFYTDANGETFAIQQDAAGHWWANDAETTASICDGRTMNDVISEIEWNAQ